MQRRRIRRRSQQQLREQRAAAALRLDRGENHVELRTREIRVSRLAAANSTSGTLIKAHVSERDENCVFSNKDTTSVMSFACSSGGAPLDRVLGSPNLSRRSSNNQLEAKVDMVYSLLAMLGGQEHADMGETLLALSTSPESCLAMRQSGKRDRFLFISVQVPKFCCCRLHSSFGAAGAVR